MSTKVDRTELKASKTIFLLGLFLQSLSICALIPSFMQSRRDIDWEVPWEEAFEANL